MKSMKKLATLSVLAALGGSAQAGIRITSIFNLSSTPVVASGKMIGVREQVFFDAPADLGQGSLTITPDDTERGVITVSEGASTDVAGIPGALRVLQYSEGSESQEVISPLNTATIVLYDTDEYPEVPGLETFVVRPHA